MTAAGRDEKAAKRFAEGLEHQKNGRLSEAKRCYELGLKRDPHNPDALFLLGQTMFELGDTRQGEHRMRTAISLAPRAGNYRAGLAFSLFNAGAYAAALVEFRLAVESFPSNMALWRGLAISAVRTEDSAQAWRAVSTWLELGPSDPDALALRRSLELQLAFDEGERLAALEQTEAACAAYERALQVDPEAVEILVNLANLYAQEHPERARALYERAIAIRPDDGAAHYNFAMALLDEGLRLEAATHLEAAVRAAPTDGRYLAHWLFQRMHLCLWDGMAELSQRVARAIAAGEADIPPFIVLSMPGTGAELQRRCAENHSRHLAARRIPALASEPQSGPRRSGRWRIGYLSSDFKNHATAFLMADLVEAYDRERFEVYALSYGVNDGSPMRARLESAFEHFVELNGCPTRQAIELIRAQDLDIVIDLKGYTEETHSEWLQYRLAPVQINWLGYPGTLGAPWADYLLADPVVAPREHLGMFSEQLLHLPLSYQPNCRERACGPLPLRADEGLPEHALVLCSFNQTYKITPEMFDLWLDILLAEPTAVLWLWASNPWAQEALWDVAAARGIARERVIFARGVAQEKHLARLHLADLALDTFPCNGHTTTSDALWAGVPVVTLCGETFASRVAASVLSAAGLETLVAKTPEQYREAVLACCREAARLRPLREIAGAFRDGPLCDGRRFARDMEQLLAHLLEQPHAERWSPAVSGAAD